MISTIAKLCNQSVWQLQHPDGSPYLTRSVLAGDDALETHTDAPYSVFHHRIHTPDADRHCHDHPWAWSVAVVLAGGYTERRATASTDVYYTRSYAVGDINILRPADYHSIIDVLPDTETLFICGREARDWGFIVDGVHIPHAEYFRRNDVQCMKTVRVR